MPIVGITPGAVRNYVSVLDDAKGTPDETVFKIGEVDSLAMARINDSFMDIAIDPEQETGVDEKGTKFRLFDWAIEMCKYGLKGWENFKDGEGNDIPFMTKKTIMSGVPREVADPECVGMIPIEIIQELAVQIKNKNTVSEEEATDLKKG